MAKVADRTACSTTTTGTGTLTIGSALTNYRSFSDAVTAGDLTDGGSVSYCETDNAGNWEVWTGVYTVAGTTLTKVTLHASSTGSAINWGAGSKDVFSTPSNDILALLNEAQTWTAAQTFSSSDLKIKGSSTGKTSLASANSSGTDYTFTIPAANATAATLGANVFTGQQTFAELKETVYTITDGAGFEIDPVNGSIQIITLGANRTPAATNFEAGQAVTMLIADGTAYTITWTTVAVTWVGGTAPTLATTGYTVIVLWKVGTTIYGKYIGSVA